MSILTWLARRLLSKRQRLALREGLAAITAIYYRGNQVICPCCGRHFRAFQQYGAWRIPNVNMRCPRCGTYERHRLLLLYLKQRTPFFRERLRVLHFAPEAVLQNRFRSLPNLDYISVDIDSPLAMVHTDITQLAFADARFDVLFCSHVLEHVPNDRHAMRELQRVLKPGGWAVILAPVDPSLETTFEDPAIVSSRDRERFYGQHDHVRLYGRDYIQRLEEAGFVVRVDRFGRELDETTIARYGINKYEDIYICTKSG